MESGFVRELIRQYRVEEVIMEEICKAGNRATDDIRNTMGDVYADSLGEAQTVIEAQADRAVLRCHSHSPTSAKSKRFRR